VRKTVSFLAPESAIQTEKSRMDGFRSLFSLKERFFSRWRSSLNREQVRLPPSIAGTRAVWSRDPEYPPPLPPPPPPPTFSYAALSTSFYYGGWCIVPTLRCVYALSTLIMNASVSSTARVLTRRARVHGRSTLRQAFFFLRIDTRSRSDRVLRYRK